MTESRESRGPAPAATGAGASQRRLQPSPSLLDALRALFIVLPGEELPALGGRLGLAILFLGGIAFTANQTLNVWVDRHLHPAVVKHSDQWEIGKEANVELTLITADARRLNCASDTAIEGEHCGFTADKHAWPRAAGAVLDDNDANVIQPYRTADTNALVLVSSLWAQPELAMRVHREPPSYFDVKKQLRFTAYCKVRFIGELKDVAMRWETGGKWLTEPKAMVAQALSCTLEPPKS